MTRLKPSALLNRIRTLAMPQTFRDFSDRQLLDAFLDRHDETAFAALVERHGAMTLGVCRRVLRNVHDAEDACQATFLVLARNAGSIRKKASLGSWLHGVAFRVASDLRKKLTRRQTVPALEKNMGMDILGEITLREAQAALDEELNRLAECYRAPLILCCLEGKARDEAAEQLGWKLNTLKSRLERGRELLRSRLVRRGITPSVALLGAVFTGSASAMMPATLVLATVQAATLAALNEALPATLLPAQVISVMKGLRQAMFPTKIKLTLLILAACALGAGLWLILAMTPQVQPPGHEPSTADTATIDTSDERATRLGMNTHAQAAAIGKLPRFSCQAKYRWGPADTFNGSAPTLERLIDGLTAPVQETDWKGFDRTIAWDGSRVIFETRPTLDNRSFECMFGHFGTLQEAWTRRRNRAGTEGWVERHTDLSELWDLPNQDGGTEMYFWDFSYLRLTPQQFHWGKTVDNPSHTLCFVPLAKTTWKHLGVAEFGGEPCEVVESAHRETDQKGQRFWISRQSGRVRGLLTTLVDPALVRKFSYRFFELVRFDDYREVTPGVWIPFREISTHANSNILWPNVWQINRTELLVEEALTNKDLADRYAQLFPKEGEKTWDDRFTTGVEYAYRPQRTDEVIRGMSEAKVREDQRVKRSTNIAQVDAMVGKPAPPLPETGWVGGSRPEVAGKPYLLVFQYLPFGKGDLPRLRTLREKGCIIIGMHRPCRATANVEQFMQDRQFVLPTFLATSHHRNKDGVWEIAGYPSLEAPYLKPYYVLVDAQGRVACHGMLSDVIVAVEAGLR